MNEEYDFPPFFFLLVIDYSILITATFFSLCSSFKNFSLKFPNLMMINSRKLRLPPINSLSGELPSSQERNLAENTDFDYYDADMQVLFLQNNVPVTNNFVLEDNQRLEKEI